MGVGGPLGGRRSPVRSDGGRGRRWTAGAGGGGLGLRERDAGEELAAGTRAQGCGGAGCGMGAGSESGGVPERMREERCELGLIPILLIS